MQTHNPTKNQDIKRKKTTKKVPRHYERKTKQKPHKETTKPNQTKGVFNTFEVA